MKMASFEYHRPTDLDEALAVLAQHGAEAKVLAGGQSLVPMLAMRLATPAHLVDISRIDGLGVARVTDAAVEIAAMVRHTGAEQSSAVATHVPLLAKAVPWIGHRAIRNRGTVCGSLAHADPAAELPAVAIALGATMVLRSTRGVREVAATDYFTGYLATAAAEDELLVATRFPVAPPGTGTAVVELARRHGDFAIAGVACSLRIVDGRVSDPAIALFGVGATPVRAGGAEAALRGSPPTASTFAGAAATVAAGLDPPGDGHATAAYRRHVAGVLVRRALTRAAAAAGVKVEAAA